MKRVWYLILLLLMQAPVVGLAQQQKSAEVLRLEARRKNLQEDIARINSLLSQAGTTVKQQLQQLTLIQNQVRKRQEMVRALNDEIKATDRQIEEMEAEIDRLQKKFEKRQESYVKSIRALQRGAKAEDQILFILSARDFAEGLRRARYLQEYAQWQKQEASKLRALREEIEVQKATLQATRDEKSQLLALRITETEQIKADQAKAEEHLKKLRGKESELKKELDRQKRQARELNRQIEAQIRKEIEEARRAALAAQKSQKKGEKATERKSVTSGGYAMTQEELKLSGNFENNKGRLPAPITGSYRVVSEFGEQQHEALRYVRVNNSGVDLQGDAGAQAKSVFDGVVTRVFTLEGFNNSVIVRHGNYLTVYSNLTDVYVTTGTKVSTGQAIGKIFSDPELGGATQLHFQVWRETTKLNPLSWIRR